MAIKKGYVIADSDAIVYRVEDTEWLIKPGFGYDDDEPGFLVPIKGAIPVDESEYLED